MERDVLRAATANILAANGDVEKIDAIIDGAVDDMARPDIHADDVAGTMCGAPLIKGRDNVLIDMLNEASKSKVHPS